MKIAVIGGGPIGIEAALYGAVAGHDVRVFERGRLAENVRQWGHVRVFTEWQRNRSPLAHRLLDEKGLHVYPDDTRVSGDELADHVLRMASLNPLKGRVYTQTEVLSLTREGCLKGDYWADTSERLKYPFRVLTKGIGGEKVRHFDAVIDATGVYSSPNWAGSGGAPCPGELTNHRAIDYLLPDVTGTDRDRFANKHTLVIGSGHSAASTLLAIADNFDIAGKTKLTWVIRRNVATDGSVYYLDPDDPLSGRRLLGERANALVDDGHIDFRPNTVVEAIERKAGRFIVTLSDGSQVECDNIAVHTGFRPDNTLWRELQIAEHPVTGGPRAISDAILQQNQRLGVGLSTGYAEKRPPHVDIPADAPDSRIHAMSLVRLREPNFFVIGIKSYGRDAGFLLQNGFRQIREVYRHLGEPELDLYGPEF